MALPLLNNQEGGTNGVTVTPTSTGNSAGASGIHFNGVTGNVTYSSDHPGAGALGLKCVQDPVTSGQAKVAWSSALIGTIASGTTFYSRSYWWLPSLPPVNENIYQCRSATAGTAFTIRYSTTGTFVIMDQANTVIYTSAVVAPANLIRMETKCLLHATAGRILVRLYFDDGTGKSAQGTTPVIEFGSDTTNQLLRGSVDAMDFGLITPGTGYTAYVSDMEVNDTGWPGPSALATEPEWWRLRGGVLVPGGSIMRLSGGALV